MYVYAEDTLDLSWSHGGSQTYAIAIAITSISSQAYAITTVISSISRCEA